MKAHPPPDVTVRTFSSQDFTRNVGAAKRATTQGSMFITDRGRPAYVLLKIEDYFQLTGPHEASLLEVMDAISGGTGVRFNPASLKAIFKATDLT